MDIMTTTTITAPTVHARHLRSVLTDGTPESLLVWLVPIDDVDVADAGLSAQQHMAVAEGRIRVLVTYDEAVDYLLAAGGDFDQAAAIATAVIGRLHERDAL
jgi:hypothetical protein